MTNQRILNEEELQVARLRQKICEKLPNGSEWLVTPHELLGGRRRSNGWFAVISRESEVSLNPFFILAFRECGQCATGFGSASQWDLVSSGSTGFSIHS